MAFKPKLEVYHRERLLNGDLWLKAVLDTAYNIIEEPILNGVSHLSFTMDYDDPKNEYCNAFWHIRYEDGELYRIMGQAPTFDEYGDIVYRCEHVLASLIDHAMIGYHVIGNIGIFSEEVLQYALDKQDKNFDPVNRVWVHDPQKKIHWVLGACEFRHQYEYGWENENVIRAVMSVPNRFTEKYVWEYDTHVYPYVLHLRKLDEESPIKFQIRKQKNLLKLVSQSDYTALCTRIYPLGEGEGINQLSITRVNSGVPYLQSPPEIVDRYGIIERIWVDRRYTDDESLMQAAQVSLDRMQEPFAEYQVDFADISAAADEQPRLGGRVAIVSPKDSFETYIVGMQIKHGEIKETKLNIANAPTNLAGTIAEMMDRQRIEQVYSQGASQVFQKDMKSNASPSIPAEFEFSILDSIKYVNVIELRVTMKGFQLPFDVSGGGGAYTTPATGSADVSYTGSTNQFQGSTGSAGGGTSGSGGGGSTSSAGGGSVSGGGGNTSSSTVNVSSTTIGGVGGAAYTNNTWWQAGGGYNLDTQTSSLVSAGTAHYHGVRLEQHNHQFSYTIPGQQLSHVHGTDSHTHSISAHTHGGDSHTHSVSAHTHSSPAHAHTMNHQHSIPNHVHTITAHTHTMGPALRYSGSPRSFRLYVNGVFAKEIVAESGTPSMQEDISMYLVDEHRMIPRNRYHKIEVYPNDNAFVSMTINVQGFIQSRGDKTI